MWDHVAQAIINTHIGWAKELLGIKSKAIWMKRSAGGLGVWGLRAEYVCAEKWLQVQTDSMP